MISKEEMYEFASLIAGITDADLEAYKCGGKTKMKKKSSGGNILDDIKNAFTPVKDLINKNLRKRTSKPTSGSLADNVLNSVKKAKNKAKNLKESEEMRRKALEARDKEMKAHPEWYDRDGHYIGPDIETNEDVKQDWMKKGRR